jgi:hypothetical protein
MYIKALILLLLVAIAVVIIILDPRQLQLIAKYNILLKVSLGKKHGVKVVRINAGGTSKNMLNLYRCAY